MIIEKLSVAGWKSGPMIEIDLSERLSVILARSPRIRIILLDTLASMGAIGVESRVQHEETNGRVSVTVLDDNQRRIMLVRDFRPKSPTRAVDLDTGRDAEICAPIAEVMSFSERELVSGDGVKSERAVWNVPIGLLVGENGKRLEEAVTLLKGVIARSGEHGDHDELDRDVKRIAELRVNRSELESRIAWLAERVSFLDSRLSAIDAALRINIEREGIDEYVRSLKEEFESWRISLAEAAAARKAVEAARSSLSEYSGLEGAFSLEIASEIRKLIPEMAELERRAVASESEQSKISSKLTTLRAELALTSRELNEIEAKGCTQRTLEQARSFSKRIEDRETLLEDISNRIAEVSKALGRKRLADRLAIGGAVLTLLSLIGLLLPGNVLSSIRISEPLMATLIFSLSTGLMCTVYGVSESIELDAKHGARRGLEQDQANLLNQLAWHRRQLESLLGGMSLNEYSLSVENARWLQEKKGRLLDDIKECGDRLAKARNEGNLVRVRTSRVKEHIGELMKKSGFSSPSKYLEAYEAYRKVEGCYREAAYRLEVALGERSEAGIERDMEIALEEIASAEAERDSIADPKIGGKVRELSEEYTVKAYEREELVCELEQRTLELADVEHELAEADMWEIASAAAEAVVQAERVKLDKKAADLARTAIEEMLEEKRAQAWARLAEVASEILTFFTGGPGAKISCVACGDYIECSLAFQPPGDETTAAISGAPTDCDSDLLVTMAAIAVRLGVNEVVNGRGTIPLIVIYPPVSKSGRIASKSACNTLSRAWPSLEKLSRTRQVILLLEGTGLDNSIPEGYGVAAI